MMQLTHDVQNRSIRYFRLTLRWTLALVALLLIATVLVLSPLVMTHAAGTHTSTTTAPSQVVPHQNPVPHIRRKVY